MNLEGFFFKKKPLISKVKAAVRGLNELGIVGFVRKVVLFGFCLLGVQRVRYTLSIYSSDVCILTLLVFGVKRYNKHKRLGI